MNDFRNYLAAIACFLAALSGVLSCVTREQSPPPSLSPEEAKAWDLPKDLGEVARNLEVLQLPSTVASLDWLPEGPKALLIRNAISLQEIRRLPRTLEILDVEGSKNLTRIDADLTRLRALNLQKTGIRHLDSLPPNLQDLGWGYDPQSADDQVLAVPDTLEGLRALVLYNYPATDLSPRSALRSLVLEEMRFSSETALPAFLEHLTLDNTSHYQPLRFPETLRDLSIFYLRSPRLSTLALPPYLTSLELMFRAPETRELPDPLPRGLERLNLRKGDYKAPEDLPSGLRLLFLLPTGNLENVPSTFRPAHLAIRLSNLQEGFMVAKGPIPTNIVLSLQSDSLKGLSSISRQIQDLRLCRDGATSSETLAFPDAAWPKLKTLDLSCFRGPFALSELPVALEVLVLETTEIKTLPSPLPEHLRVLDLRGTAVDNLKILNSTSLETLLLSSNSSMQLEKLLPQNLKRLYLVAETDTGRKVLWTHFRRLEGLEPYHSYAE